MWNTHTNTLNLQSLVLSCPYHSSSQQLCQRHSTCAQPLISPSSKFAVVVLVVYQYSRILWAYWHTELIWGSKLINYALGKRVVIILFLDTIWSMVPGIVIWQGEITAGIKEEMGICIHMRCGLIQGQDKDKEVVVVEGHLVLCWYIPKPETRTKPILLCIFLCISEFQLSYSPPLLKH